MNGPMSQQHGFARNMRWEVIGTSADMNRTTGTGGYVVAEIERGRRGRCGRLSLSAHCEVTLRRGEVEMRILREELRG